MGSKAYEDILEPRRAEFSHFLWVSRKVEPMVAYKQQSKPTPSSHKESVLKDPRMQEFLSMLSAEKCIPKDFLETQVRLVLDEIGYNKNWKVISPLALILVKICLKVCKGIYANKGGILNTKICMGNCPVIFVPSHRSYADFILMSFICFTYEMEIPAVAAGMDFHGMWAMGSILRDTGAFFMRRSYNDDTLYWTTFKQYIFQLVTKGDLPIEFFIEGTRSRSNKSLMPKYGLLNMILKPLFLRQVPDILFVPINISYEKILEEKLFSFELLGVPKPKESTSGLFKSLSIIKQKYGSIHMTFGQPISSKQFFSDHLDRSRHSIGPVHRQELTETDKLVIPSLAHEILHAQQTLAILNVINLIALIVNHNFITSQKLLSLRELPDKIRWLKEVLEKFGSTVWSTHVDEEIKEAFLVHKNILRLTNEGDVDVVKNKINLTNMNVEKLKAHNLSEMVMTVSVPFVMLYIYINPILHYVVDAAMIVAIMRIIPKINSDDLFVRYIYLRKLFIHEFVTHSPRIPAEYNNALNHCLNLGLIQYLDSGTYNLADNSYLQDLLVSTIQPYIYSYFNVINILQAYSTCDEKTILIEAQKRIVFQMEQKRIHPYSLNLDSISHCLSSLVEAEALKRIRRSSQYFYEVDSRRIESVKTKLEPYICEAYREDKIENSPFKHKL